MKNAKQTVIVFDSASELKEVHHRMQQKGFSRLKVIEHVERLRTTLKQDSDQVILVPVLDLPFSLIVANIRTLIGVGGLIVVREKCPQKNVSDLLIAGADVVMTLDEEDYTELFAWYNTLRRRAESFLLGMRSYVDKASNADATLMQSAEPSIKTQGSMWYLGDGGWALISPENKKINLTHGEKLFLTSFIGESDKRVSREEVLELNSIEDQNSRAVDSLVSRLRRKAAEKGFSLPIKSIHGWGYGFIGALQFVGVDVETEAAIQQKAVEQRFLEINSVEIFNQQLQGGRFAFSFQPIVNNTTGRYDSAVTNIVWKPSQGEPLPIEHFWHHLEHLGVLHSLCDWAVNQLHSELRSWRQEYDFTLPLYLPWPAEMFMRVVSILEEQLQALSDPHGLSFLVYGVSNTVDVIELNGAFERIHQAGGSVWLRLEQEIDQRVMDALHSISGVSFTLNSSLIAAGESRVLHLPFMAYTRRLGLPILCERVDNTLQKDFSTAIGAKYITGKAVALPLSREGLLLAWASQEDVGGAVQLL